MAAPPDPPVGFIPLAEAMKPPEGFIPLAEAKQLGVISPSLARDLPMVGEFKGLNKFFFEIPGFAEKGTMNEVAKAAATSFLVSVSSDEESAKILMQQFPGSKILKDEEGGTIFVSPEGKEYALDAPGIDAQDIARAATEVAGFALAPSRTAMSSFLQAGGIQAGIETAQEAGGGSFEAGDIAAVGIGAGVGHVATQFLGRGLVSLREGAKEIIRKGEELGSPILTTDIVDPNSASAITRFITRIADKYPGIGTAGKRASQRQVRNNIGRALAEEFDITADLERYPQFAAEALSNVHEANMKRAVDLRTEVLEEINQRTSSRARGFVSQSALDKPDYPIVPNTPRTQQVIEDQLRDLTRPGMRSDQTMIIRLQDVMQSLPKVENFNDLVFVRSRIIRMMKEAERGMNPDFPSELFGRLTGVKKSLDAEMNRFVGAIDKELERDWRQSNRLFADEYSAYDRSILAKLASEGVYAADKLVTTLKSTDTKSLKQLYRQMDEVGRKNARAAILQNALAESGHFVDEFKIGKFATQMSKPAIRVFFPANQRAQLEGIAKYARATKGADAAKDLAATGAVYAELSLAPLSPLGKLYQSDAMRDMLVRLAKTDVNSKKGKTLITGIRRWIDDHAAEITAGTAVYTPEGIEDILD